MKYEISEEHSSNNLSPLTIKIETKVRLGERSDGVDNWPNWIHCCTLDGELRGRRHP